MACLLTFIVVVLSTCVICKSLPFDRMPQRKDRLLVSILSSLQARNTDKVIRFPTAFAPDYDSQDNQKTSNIESIYQQGNHHIYKSF